MNKTELIAAVAEKAHLTKKDAGAAIDSAVAVILETLAKGESVAFVGFGTLEVRERKARTGKNPLTGQPLEIPAAKVPVFKAGKQLKDAAAGK